MILYVVRAASSWGCSGELCCQGCVAEASVQDWDAGGIQCDKELLGT